LREKEWLLLVRHLAAGSMLSHPQQIPGIALAPRCNGRPHARHEQIFNSRGSPRHLLLRLWFNESIGHWRFENRGEPCVAPFVVSDGFVRPAQLKRYRIDVGDFVVSKSFGARNEFVSIGFETSPVLPLRRDPKLQADKLLRSLMPTYSQFPCCRRVAFGSARV